MNFKKLIFNLAMWGGAVSFSGILTAMEMEEKLPEEMEIEEGAETKPKIWTIINDTGRDVYMRIRSGEVGPDTEKILPPEPFASQLMINGETFKFPKETTVSIDLTQIKKWPLRFRFWKTSYQPKEDINVDGKPLETSPENLKNAWLALSLKSRDDITENERAFPYFVLITAWNGELGTSPLKQGEEWKPQRYIKSSDLLQPMKYIKVRYIKSEEVGELFK